MTRPKNNKPRRRISRGLAMLIGLAAWALFLLVESYLPASARTSVLYGMATGLAGVGFYFCYDYIQENWFGETGHAIDELRDKGYEWAGVRDLKLARDILGDKLDWVYKLPPRDEAFMTPAWRGDSFASLAALGELVLRR